MGSQANNSFWLQFVVASYHPVVIWQGLPSWVILISYNASDKINKMIGVTSGQWAMLIKNDFRVFPGSQR
jgi:hypothetical protein